MNRSLAQLLLLAENVNRLEAQRALVHGQMTLLAVAACMTKEGMRAYRATEKTLKKQAGIE